MGRQRNTLTTHLTANMADSIYDVVVIGAGMAGLTAARALA
jgi:cation diffusion facilitator CzcD-associated flavoprotein CzcO